MVLLTALSCAFTSLTCNIPTRDHLIVLFREHMIRHIRPPTPHPPAPCFSLGNHTVHNYYYHHHHGDLDEEHISKENAQPNLNAVNLRKRHPPDEGSKSACQGSDDATKRAVLGEQGPNRGYLPIAVILSEVGPMLRDHPRCFI